MINNAGGNVDCSALPNSSVLDLNKLDNQIVIHIIRIQSK